MIIKEKMYECPICKKFYFFNISTNYKAWCEECQCNLVFLEDITRDTDLEEQRKNLPPYDPTQDPNSPYYIPVIRCPYCQSTDTTKISTVNRVVSTGLFGLGSNKVGKEWHCNKCKSNF